MSSAAAGAEDVAAIFAWMVAADITGANAVFGTIDLTARATAHCGSLFNDCTSESKAVLSLMVGGSYGAGNYAMCGRAFDPMLTLAWPSSACSVMGAAQAANTLLQIDLAARKRKCEEVDEDERRQLLEAITDSYREQQDIRYGAARGWIDRMIEPHRTRAELTDALQIAAAAPVTGEFRTGVLQT